MEFTFEGSMTDPLQTENDHIEPDARSAARRERRLLETYHGLGLLQSRASFWFSLIFASLGFGLIGLAVVEAEQLGVSQGSTVVPLVAGVVVDAVAGLFFVQANRARLLMAEFFDRLRADERLRQGLQLVESITDSTLQSRAKMILALSLAAVETTDEQLNALIEIPGRAALTSLPSEVKASGQQESHVGEKSGR
jgi:hypothetical protein